MIRIATSFNVALVVGLFRAISFKYLTLNKLLRLYSVTSTGGSNTPSTIEEILSSISLSARYTSIQDIPTLTKFRLEFKGKSGIYGIYCKPSGKIYVGSAIDLYSRVRNGHLGANTIRSNSRLQRAIRKYG